MNTEKTINALIKEYTEQMDAKPYVQRNTLWVLQKFVRFMVVSKINVTEPRKADIICYKNHLISEGKTPATVNRYLAPVRGFFRWLDSCGYYQNVSDGVKSPRDERSFLRDYLTPPQVIQLLESIPTNTIKGLRDYAMITLMVFMGFRRVEILRLQCGDIFQSNGERVINVHRKGRDYKQLIKLEDEVYTPIELYLNKRKYYSEASPLFANHSNHSTDTISEVSVSKIIKEYLKKIKDSNKLTCHSLRHSAAINLLKSGRSIYDVSNMLGHKHVGITQLYLKAIEAEERFNNSAARDLLLIYKNSSKIANKGIKQAV